jgi:sugar phosphate isomerase/epimerase
VFKKLKLSMYAFNIFMPGEMKLVGPDVNEESILKYARSVFQRCNRAGVNMIIWGSGGARRVPDGYDHKKAKEQFIAIARKVAMISKTYNITIALENLNSTETNFINTVDEALNVVKAVDHPNFLLCADIYHMLMEHEAAGILEKTKGYLIHCDIAERDGRTPPGFHGDDFGPYLSALRKVGYTGLIVLECRWNDVSAQAVSARESLQKQIDMAYRP